MLKPHQHKALFTSGLALYCLLAAGSVSTNCGGGGGGDQRSAASTSGESLIDISDPELARLGQRLGILVRGVIGGASGVDMGQIRQAATLVGSLMSFSQRFANDTTQSVQASYQDLGAFLRENKMTDAQVQTIERRLGEMRGKAGRLDQALQATRQGGNQLFSLLEKRAMDNTNEQLRDKMLNDIAGKKGEFVTKVDRARNALIKLNSSIKNYDNILGYVQVNRGLKGVDQFMVDIDKTVQESASLNREIQSAIQEGLRIIDPSAIR